MKLFAWRALAFLAFSPLFSTVAGCGNQLEGERCDRDNGNTDCESGLICTTVFVPNAQTICCPPSGATVDTCNAGRSPPVDGGTMNDAGANPDGATDASTPDATNDPSTEPTDDRSTVDTRPDIRADTSADVSADMSTRDIQAEGAAGDAQDALAESSTADRTPDGADDTSSIDAPSFDGAIDAPPDTVEASVDAPLDVATPDDAADSSDAPSADGPG